MQNQNEIANFPPSPVAYMPTVIKVTPQSGELIATHEVETALICLQEQKRQLKALQKSIEVNETIIKSYMGLKEILVDSHGIELATWKYNKDSEKVDSKRLQLEYPEVYNQVAELVAGARVFRIA